MFVFSAAQYPILSPLWRYFLFRCIYRYFTSPIRHFICYFHAKGLCSEDFGLNNAKRILDKYRPEIACFNDDIQGTGCITLAAIMSGLHVSKLKLTEMRVVVFGSGTAGIGIADQIRDAIAVETGNSKEEAVKQIW